MTKSAQEALEKINATQKSIADKAEEITKSVEDANDKEEKAEKSEQPEQKECDDKEAKKSEVEDKKDDKEEDKEEKSESKESTGKLEHEKAPEKDPAAKSLEADITSGTVEAHELKLANVANTGVDYLEAVNKSLDFVNTMFGAYQELAKSVTADKAEEVTKSVEKAEKDMDDPDDEVEESAKSKKSEVEDKEEKSESKESTGKLEHEKAPEKDPAAKSEDKGEVEKSMVSVKPLGEDKTEKSITDDSGISKKDFINVVSKSINNYEDANNVINYSDSISLLKSLKEKASEADYISNDMVEEYEKA